MFKTVRSLLFVVVAMSLLLAACGAPATTVAPTAMPAPVKPTKAPEPIVAATEDPMAMYAPDAVSGDIITAGSSTVFPLSERMSELFQQEGYTGNITVDSIGTGGGFERFCKTGETDVANASRKIKDAETELCKALATPRDPIAFRVGTDALTVVVSSENDFVTVLTKEQLGKIFTAQYTKWNEVDPAFPTETILVYGPGADSGTFDYFNEVVVAPLYLNADGKADVAVGVGLGYRVVGPDGAGGGAVGQPTTEKVDLVGAGEVLTVKPGEIERSPERAPGPGVRRHSVLA